MTLYTLPLPIYGAIGIFWLAFYYIFPCLTKYKSLSPVPGPFLAKFSNTWLAYSARIGKKFATIDEAHRKYGKMVRVGFNHVSIADESALNVRNRYRQKNAHFGRDIVRVGTSWMSRTTLHTISHLGFMAHFPPTRIN